jgi:hypothetical protein
MAGYSRGLASSRFGAKVALFFEPLDRFNRRWKEKNATAVGLKTGVARWLRDAIAAGDVRKIASSERIAIQYGASVFGIIYRWLVNPDAIDCGQGLDELRENTLHVIRE